MSGTTNLYPPIVTPYLPAFDKTQNSYQIKFQLSSFNIATDFNLIYTQIRIDHQNSNSSALNSQYTTGIKFVSAAAIEDEDGWYSINIANTDFTFDKNKYYKVQIRMSGANITAPTDNLHSIEWEKNNVDKCSAWSTVCLIKGIVPPTLTIGTFSSFTDNTITTPNLTVAGTFQFETGEKEYIKSYQCDLYVLNDIAQTLVYTSDKIYSLYNTPNNINHIINYRLKQGLAYKLRIRYETNNLFQNSINYHFIYSLSTMPIPKLQLSVKNDENRGRLKILISTLENGIIYSGLTISRSSNLTNFNIWEDVHIITLDAPSVDNYIWYDTTIQNGIYYKYSIQNISSTKVRSFAIETNEPILAIFEDSFLTNAERQLNIKLNPQINSFSKKVTESVTETLGSKYPFIRRNGDVEYKTFGISGLISSFCDECNLFTSPQELYGEYSDLYNSNENIKNNYSNILYEKDFREKVIEFLYANNVKLFRSPTEGNILVKLTNISLTPEQTLGRMLYSFSATAHEIADISIDNYIKYGVLQLCSNPDILTKELYAYTQVPSMIQLNQSFSANEDILALLIKKGKLNKVEQNEDNIEFDKICYIRIDFLDDVKLISDNNGVLEYSPTGALQGFLIDITFKDDTQQRLLIQPTTQIVTLENTNTKVGIAAFFEMNENSLYISEIKNISFPVITNAFIDSALYFKTRINTDDFNIVSYQNLIYKYSVGQEYGAFNRYWSFKDQLATKYNTKINNKQYILNNVYYVYIEANNGTIVSVKLKSKDVYEDYMIENNDVLEISADIEDIKFKGQSYIQVNNINPNEGQYYKTNIIVSSIDKIANPVERYVYTINNQQKIYLNQQFYDFTSSIVNIPTSALINYYYILQEAIIV